ncbi:hypothetical protein GYMLUDRAFT_242810 [Collybiopsis luxurians FD-317 M1]|uniref:Unplaced genomic scaffold GYMLUscaffold_20, whole genome shotgun sequence n=1 Tax=Collybiopsis luxurians FD-317 M1 TaxID=944289 RepID=A0A0D0C202_9AGAR|nr:hypothetical protein GYMLUDRAFT_242810 [Collybiopsis luxurians FD-317 M1]
MAGLFMGELIGNADEIVTKDQNRLNKLIAQAKDIASAVNTKSTLTTEGTVKANQQILQDTATKLDDYLEKSVIESLEKQLNPVKDAYINSDKVCLEGTRVQILEKISQWVKNTEDNSPQMFLLCGAAGTGKSAISHAIGKQFKAMNYLGAFFAFDRTFIAEQTPVRAVQSIAYDLSKQIPKFGKALIKTLEDNSNILRDPSLTEQWKELILKPAQDSNENKPVVIILDALDESGKQRERDKLISLLLDGKEGLPKDFYVFMTSRLEGDIVGQLDGKRIVSGSDDCSVRIWDAETGEPQGQPLQGHTNWVNSVALRIWDAKTGEPQGQPFQGHTSLVNSVAFSPDGKRIVSGSRDCSVRIWDVETGEPQGQPLQGHTSLVNSVAFSPDGKRIVSGSSDYSMRIWDAETGEPQGQPLQGHTNLVNSVAFSPDEKRIVSGSWDYSVRIWDAGAGEPQGQPLQGYTSWVSSVAFSPDGKRIVSGSDDCSVGIWDAETREP